MREAAAAAFEPPPKEAELAAFGLKLSDYPEKVVELWPDCWPAWQLFCELSGQWRTSGMGDRIALDYTPLFMRMDRMGLSDDEWNELFTDIRVIEGSALDAMQKK